MGGGTGMIGYIIKRILIVFAVFYSFNAVGQQPDIPEISSLGFDPTSGDVVLKWKSPDIAQNVIAHEVSRREYTSVDYFFMSNAKVNMPDTVYSEQAPNTSAQRYGYRLRSTTGIHVSPLSDMHLTTQFAGEYTQCSNTITLLWTEYRRYAIDENGQIDFANLDTKKFNDAIEYEVWGHHGTGFDIALAERLTDRSKKNSDIKLENLTIGTKYFLFVKSFLPNGDTATSYRVEIETINRRLPTVMNIDSVVSEAGTIHLFLNVDKKTEIDTFAIYRVGTRIPLAWFYSASEIPAQFTDKTISIGQVYHYNIVGFMCGRPLLKSDTVSNILMYATPSGLNANIKWTEFFNEAEIPIYTLHRISPALLDIDPGNALEFLDNSTEEFVCSGPQKFCYEMTAKTSKSFARSEQACVSLNSSIIMPDAIDPLSDISVSKNCRCNIECETRRRLFGPLIDIDNNACRLEIEIYDRSGEQLFRSKKDFTESLNKEFHYWNGKYRGNYVKPGVYVYYVKVEFREMPPVTLRGSVTVVMTKQ